MSKWAWLRPYLSGLAVATAIGFMALPVLRQGRQEAVVPTMPAPTATASTVTVFVGGAVLHPGVYTLPQGERIEAAIQAAGGFSADADQDGINRAQHLRDEDRLIIPRKGEPTATLLPRPTAALPTPEAGRTTTARPAPSPTPSGPINVNRAGVDELARLPGVGPRLAQAIVDYRAQNGPFKDAAALARVQGISERMVAGWADLIIFGP